MSRTYDQWDMDRPIAQGAIDRFLSLQQRIEAVLETRLDPWHQAEYGTAVPYGTRLKSIDYKGLHFEVWPHYEDRPQSTFVVPFEILTDTDFEATCAAKLAARAAVAVEKAAAEAKTKRANAARTRRANVERERTTYARLHAKFGGASAADASGASHV
jgi:hypothetical protein